MSTLVAIVSKAIQDVLLTVIGLTGVWQTQAPKADMPYCVWRHLSPDKEVDSDGEVASCPIEVIIYGESTEDVALIDLQRDVNEAFLALLDGYLQGATLVGLTLGLPRVIILDGGYCQTNAEHLIMVE